MTHTILQGDTRNILPTLPDQSVQCVVTSPPYFGLRQYMPDGHPDKDKEIGVEPTPQEFTEAMVVVFREVRRVLKDDGTLWLNLGDSYCNTPRGNRGDWSSSGLNGAKTSAAYQSTLNAGTAQTMNKSKLPGVKQKDLIGIPWRVAFALQADGWYLRQDIIWHKTTGMPESVKDRCTRNHEYLFLLSKSRTYYFDAEAIKTPAKQDWGTRDRSKGKYHNEGSGLQPHSGLTKSYATANKRSVWTISPSNYKDAHFATFPPALVEPCILAGSAAGDTVLDPFLGSGTTLAVAKQHGRNGIGVELNPEYAALAQQRIDAVAVPLS